MAVFSASEDSGDGSGELSGAPVKVHPTAAPSTSARASATAITVLGFRAMRRTRSRTRRLLPVMVVAVCKREHRPAAIMSTKVRP